MKRKLFLAVAMVIMLFLSGLTSVSADTNLKAKIGISVKSRGKGRPAQDSERVTSGEYLSLTVAPFSSCYIYVINADDKNAIMLNSGQYDLKQALKAEFEVANESNRESLVIVMSEGKNDKIEAMFAGNNVPTSEWRNLEDSLFIEVNSPDNEKLELSGASAERDKMTGDVFKIFTAKKLIFKKYQFYVRR